MNQGPGGDGALALDCLRTALSRDPALSASVSVRVITESVERDVGAEELAARILAATPDVVGFSCYVWNMLSFERTAAVVKQRDPGVCVVFGGPEVEADNLGRLQDTAADVLVIGEGEEVFADWLRKRMGLPVCGRAWDGLMERQDGRFRWDGGRALASDLGPEASPHLMAGVAQTREHVYWETARGCAFECAFCHYDRSSPTVRHLPFGRLERELHRFELTGVRRVYLLDPTFNGDRRRAKELLRLICRRCPSVRFHAELRAEMLDEETVDLLRAARFEFLEVGLQSANPRALRRVRRPTSLASGAASSCSTAVGSSSKST